MSGITFYFEFASPYGYFASTRVQSIADEFDCELTWKPILLGPIFKNTGMGPLFHQPMRGEYARIDCRRIADLLGIPYTEPASFPMHSVAASRLYYWLEASHPEHAVDYIHMVYRAHWGEGRNLSEATILAQLLEEHFHIDSGDALRSCSDQAFKDRLRLETQQAEQRGVFGSPFLFVDDEPFWGFDRLDYLRSVLRKTKH